LSTSNKRVWKAWLPAFIWLGIIVLESTNLGSSEHTFSLLYPFFHYLFGVTHASYVTWNHAMRKAGHCIGYSVLTLLLYRAWRATLSGASLAQWAMPWATISFLMTAFVASLDEWHQSYLPSRTGRWQDAVLDSCAALTAQIILWAILRHRRQPTPATQT